MNTSYVTLDDMLKCRERRAEKQRALLGRFNAPLICLNMNIPGPVKDSPLIRLGFEEGVSRILRAVRPAYRQICFHPTGPEGYFVADIPANELKSIGVGIEESDALGRLFDIDVFDLAGRKLARETQRRCIICGNAAAACARSRAHGLEAVCEKVNTILSDHAAELYGDIAYRALISEALVTPKPGLVDAENNGAHRDMCLSTLIASAASLRLFFVRAFRMGLDEEEDGGKDVSALKREGLRAEEEMLRATGGVNAHKGSIYAFGLLLFAQGVCMMNGGNVIRTAADIAGRGLTGFPAEKSLCQSHGERAYALWGAQGARGEASQGFPHAVEAAKLLRKHASKGKNEAALIALCTIMSKLNDTNLLHRGGTEGLELAQAGSRSILDMKEAERTDALRELDNDMTERNLSPGGAADMLALGIYMDAANIL